MTPSWDERQWEKRARGRDSKVAKGKERSRASDGRAGAPRYTKVGRAATARWDVGAVDWSTACVGGRSGGVRTRGCEDWVIYPHLTGRGNKGVEE